MNLEATTFVGRGNELPTLNKKGGGNHDYKT